MSVDFTTMIGYGYIIDWDMVKHITDKNDEAWDNIFATDEYSDREQTTYFFGVDMKTLYCGDYTNIKPFIEGDLLAQAALDFIVLIKELDLIDEFTFCDAPSIYIINRVS